MLGNKEPKKGGMMCEKQVIVTVEDDFGKVQTSITISLSAPQLMDKIFELEEENERLKSRNSYNVEDMQMEIGELKEENEQLRQIATKTEEEKEEYADLYNEYRKENEQLRKELDNFKPVMFQDVRKGTVILYSKGDIDE